MSALPRILIVSSRFARTGGTGAHVMASTSALRAAGFEVTVAAGERGHEALEPDDFHLLPGLERVGRVPTSAARGLAELLQRSEIGVVHVHDVTDVRLLERLQENCPLVWSVHNYFGCIGGYKYFPNGAACHRPHGPGCVGNVLVRGCSHRRVPRPSPFAYRLSSRLLSGLRKADAVVACSDYLARDLQINSVGGAKVVPPFVHPPANVSPPPPDRHVLFCGRVTSHKGLSTLIRAATLNDDFTLEICGDGWGIADARKSAERLGVAERLTFRGWVSESELATAYDRARVVVVPSLLPETFGLVGIEAMAHARPVIASASGGIPEWLADGVTGMLVPPGDVAALAGALKHLLGDSEYGAAMGLRGRQRVLGQFSPQLHVERLAEVYRRAAAHWRANRATRSVHPAARLAA